MQCLERKSLIHGIKYEGAPAGSTRSGENACLDDAFLRSGRRSRRWCRRSRRTFRPRCSRCSRRTRRSRRGLRNWNRCRYGNSGGGRSRFAPGRRIVLVASDQKRGRSGEQQHTECIGFHDIPLICSFAGKRHIRALRAKTTHELALRVCNFHEAVTPGSSPRYWNSGNEMHRGRSFVRIQTSNKRQKTPRPDGGRGAA